MATFGMWHEGGTLFIGPLELALGNTLIDDGDDYVVLAEAAAELAAEDATDTYYPGGIRTVGITQVATLNRLSLAEEQLAGVHTQTSRLEVDRQSDKLRDALASATGKSASLDGLIDERVRESLERRERGAELLSMAIAVTTGHAMTYEERLLLRSEMRDGAIDGASRAAAMKAGSFAKVMGELERGMVRQVGIRSQLADEQRDLIGRANLAESFLPVRDQNILETAMIDGRVNLRTMQRFFETGQDQRIVNTIEELDDEYADELSRNAGREIAR